MTLKPIDDLSDAELRVEIAERRGWRVFVDANGGYAVYNSDGLFCDGKQTDANSAYKEAWNHIPDWPNNAGDALALCLDVCGGVEIDTYSVQNTIIVRTRSILVSVLKDRGVARALSMLACVALRAQGDDDD